MTQNILNPLIRIKSKTGYGDTMREGIRPV